MARRVFYSFHYEADNWRTQQVRQISAVEGDRPAQVNAWESIRREDDASIKRWIGEQMRGRTCVVVLIGAATAGRPWINYEIAKGWNEGMGLLGIHVHSLADSNGRQADKGRNPFREVRVGGFSLDRVAAVWDPGVRDSAAAYRCIASNLTTWIEGAIKARGNH